MSVVSPSPLRAQEHPDCVACGLHHPSGLHMQFHPAEDGGVTATVDCSPAMQGYIGVVHGGIISLMLDAAMTNCLFQRGVSALTAQLSLRFRDPLHAGRSAVVSARVVRESGNAFVVEGNIVQDNRLKAKAEAIFMRKTRAPVARCNGES
jgi:uncharacterized protein (TIGR00369 family)